MRNVIIGTAGHVDHGKTHLIRAFCLLYTSRRLDREHLAGQFQPVAHRTTDRAQRPPLEYIRSRSGRLRFDLARRLSDASDRDGRQRQQRLRVDRTRHDHRCGLLA